MRDYFLWLAKFITTLVVIFIAIPLLLAVIGGALISLGSLKTLEHAEGTGTVAVIELKGMIDDVSDELKALYRQVDDDSIDGVVLRIDSPGGAIGPSQEIYQAVKKLKERKPIVASMGAVAASGGLYAALGASKVLAEPGTMTGSIGVIAQFPALQQISEMIGFRMVTIKSGALKDVGNPFREMTDSELQFLEQTLHAAHEDFIAAVADGRQIPIDRVRTFADGRLLLGAQAKDLGLIDGYGDVYDASRIVFELKGQPLPVGEYPNLKYVKGRFPEFLQELVETKEAMVRLFQRSMKVMYLMP